MDNIPNRFLRYKDLQESEYKYYRKEIEEYYKTKLKGTPHPWGSKSPESIITHWSREWEYPWAIINSEINSSYKILDCGCGGSPLIFYLADKFNCNSFGIDRNYGNDLVNNQISYISSGNILCNLRKVFVEPSLINNNCNINKGDMTSMPYENNYFHRVFCISVIEHLESEDLGLMSIKEMVRVLKPGGKLLVTMDHTSYKDHVKKWCLGNYQKIIEWSGLKLNGNCNFSVPSYEEIHGYYHVLGFILEK